MDFSEEDEDKDYRAIPTLEVESICEDEAEEEFSRNLSKVHGGTIKLRQKTMYQKMEEKKDFTKQLNNGDEI